MTKGNVVPFVKNGERAVTSAERVSCCSPSRLMTAKGAASYLGYKSPSILKKLGLTPVRLELVGGDRGEPKYDRLELDALIERSRTDGLQSDSGRVVEVDDADDALMQWRLKRGA